MAFNPSVGGIGALGALGRSTSVSGVNSPMNTDALIAHLVEMTPDQRKQFASMHADDPMMLSAAKYVDNKIKQQATVSMAQQTGASPPVNQQAVASMAGVPPQQMSQGLPEETGIGALPVPAMKHMATGGIVAFGGKGESLVRSQNGGEDYFLDVPATIRDPSVPYYQEIPNPMASLAGQKFKSREEAVQAYDAAIPEPAQDYQSGPQLRSPKAKNIATMPTDDTRRTDSRFPSGVAALTPVSAPVGQRGTSAPTGANLAPSAGAMSIADLQKAQAGVMPKGPVADPYAAEHAQSAAELKAVNEEGVANAQAQKEGLAGLLAPREQRIKAREDRLKYTDDQNLNMSLINAGLAMMQSRGQGLAGIAEGAGVGVKQYSEGLKLSEAARQKIEDAKDAFDELKFNQTNMTNKAVTDAKAKVAEGAIAMRNAGIASSEKATGLAHDDAKALFSSYVQSREAGLDRASRERTAAFSAQVQKEIAAMPGGQEKLFATLGDGDAKKGLNVFTAANAEGKGDEAIMQAVIKSPEILGAINPELRKIIEQRIASRFAPQVQDKAGSRP